MSREGRVSNEAELKAKAVFEAYSTLRAVEYSLRQTAPLVSAHCTGAREQLLAAFPELQRVETVFRLTEQDALAARNEGGATK